MPSPSNDIPRSEAIEALEAQEENIDSLEAQEEKSVQVPLKNNARDWPTIHQPTNH